MSTFIEIGKELDEDLEDKAVPEGSYDLRILRVDIQPGKKDPSSRNIRVMLKVLGDAAEGAANIFHYIGIPNADDPNKRTKLQMMKRFMMTFGCYWDADTGAFDVEEWPGKEARCNLKKEVYEGNERNVLDLPRVEANASPQHTGLKRKRG